MAGIEITGTELVWPGKYDEDGTRKQAPRVRGLPFQVIERVSESRATREALKAPRTPSLLHAWGGNEEDTSQAVEVEVE